MSWPGQGPFTIRGYAKQRGLPIHVDGTRFIEFEASTIRGRLALLKAFLTGKLRLYYAPGSLRWEVDE